MHSTTQAAIAAIGEDKPDADYKLRPEQHAAAMTAAAGPLAPSPQPTKPLSVVMRTRPVLRVSVQPCDQPNEGEISCWS